LTGLLFAWPRCTSMLAQSCAWAHSFTRIFARLASRSASCAKSLRM